MIYDFILFSFFCCCNVFFSSAENILEHQPDDDYLSFRDCNNMIRGAGVALRQQYF